MLDTFFDPESEWFNRVRLRPHWMQAGAVAFLTFRTIDSIPREVVLRWDREKTEWLRSRGVPVPGSWADAVRRLTPADRLLFNDAFDRTRDVELDRCHGDCVLRRPELARIVADSLMYFDGERYSMGDFVVMPNHVHLLAAFPTEEAMTAACDSWLHFTATRINNVLKRRGHFWQDEPFDHLVRNQKSYEYYRDYIAENPIKANLGPGEYVYRRLPDVAASPEGQVGGN